MKEHRFDRRLMLFGTFFGAFLLFLGGCDKKTTVQVNPSAGGGDDGETVEWLTDWEKAKEVAQAENKDLLVDFSGSDWCGWCIKLEKEVFEKAEFFAASEDFVFVLLDFPNDRSGQSDELQQQNERLSQQFGVQYFPTIFLADADGKPYAKTGYVEGGPKVYLDHLQELKNQK